MSPLLRIAAILVILVATSVAWTFLGLSMNFRTMQASGSLHEEVAELWGRPMEQAPPQVELVWTEKETVTKEIYDVNLERNVLQKSIVDVERRHLIPAASSDIRADFKLDPRRRGLLWFSLFDVDFEADYAFVNTTARSEMVEIGFRFPSYDGVYDGFRFQIDGRDVAANVGGNGPVDRFLLEPGQEIRISLSYRSRGMTHWTYRPNNGVGVVENLSLAMTTDFGDIDFPPGTLSPTSRKQVEDGWSLRWSFDRLVTGAGMGMLMPEHIQPGNLAQKIAFSSPVSLVLFFLMMGVLSLRQGLDLHPMHFCFLAGAFFAFPLLFAYLADHLAVYPAFAISSAVSLLLVTSYMRLVVSDGFAFGPSALAQLIYQVGFSLAHFWEGFTGLTVTLLGILTLFVLMQLTGRQDWNVVFQKKQAVPLPAG